MRTIEGCLCVGDKARSLAGSGFPLLLKPASSQVTSLVLESHIFHPEDIKATVLACRSLKKLELTLLSTYSSGDAIAGLVAATLQAPQTLEILSLRYPSNKEAYEWRLDGSSERYLMSLVVFPNLRGVTLGVFFLLGGHLFLDSSWREGLQSGENGGTVLRRLPPQIESLRIILCNGEEAVPIFANVEGILWRKSEGQFQKLVLIIVEYLAADPHKICQGQTLLGRYESPDTEPYLKVKRLATSVGVNFDMLHSEETSLI